MPLYTYECQTCGKETEKVYPMDNCPRTIECIHCTGKAKKILAIGHGSIFTDNDVPWLASACMTLQAPGEPRLTTRTEYREYLKKKKLIPIG